MLKKLAQASFVILLASVPASTTYAANLISVTQSSASSGGITAGEGEIIVSTSSKSVSQVRTTIKSTGEHGRVETEVVTTKDGVTTRELRTEVLAPEVTTIVNRSTSTAGVRQRKDIERVAPVDASVRITAITSEEKVPEEVAGNTEVQPPKEPQAMWERFHAWAVRFPVLNRVLAFWGQS